MIIPETTTIGQLAELVENYYGLEERIKKLEKTKEMTVDSILDAFALTGMTTFTTPSGLTAIILNKDGGIVLRVSRSEAKKLSSHSLDINMHFQNQG